MSKQLTETDALRAEVARLESALSEARGEVERLRSERDVALRDLEGMKNRDYESVKASILAEIRAALPSVRALAAPAASTPPTKENNRG